MRLRLINASEVEYSCDHFLLIRCLSFYTAFLRNLIFLNIPSRTKTDSSKGFDQFGASNANILNFRLALPKFCCLPPPPHKALPSLSYASEIILSQPFL